MTFSLDSLFLGRFEPRPCSCIISARVFLQSCEDTVANQDAQDASNLPPIFSVGELSQAVKRIVEDAFGYVRVRGEVSQPGPATNIKPL